jgi:hypothetical protein
MAVTLTWTDGQTDEEVKLKAVFFKNALKKLCLDHAKTKADFSITSASN